MLCGCAGGRDWVYWWTMASLGQGGGHITQEVSKIAEFPLFLIREKHRYDQHPTPSTLIARLDGLIQPPNELLLDPGIAPSEHLQTNPPHLERELPASRQAYVDLGLAGAPASCVGTKCSRLSAMEMDVATTHARHTRELHALELRNLQFSSNDHDRRGLPN